MAKDKAKIKWLTDETYNLSERMAKRAVKLFKNIPEGLSALAIARVVRNPKSTVPNKYLPEWLMKLDLEDYDDSWNDWTIDEQSAIEERLLNGIDHDTVQDVFSVPENIMGTLRRRATKNTLELIDERDSYFNADDIPDGVTRKRANMRWKEFSLKVNLTNPVNATMIRSLIMTEINLRRVEREMLDCEPVAMRDLQVVCKELTTQFSKLSEDIASLERQQDIRPIEETFDAVISRHNDIKKDWRDISKIGRAHV